MPDRTLLYLTDDAGTHLQLWRQQGETSPQSVASGAWDEPAVKTALDAVAQRGDALWVAMPASWGSLLQVPIPSRRREQAQLALSFAIEDLVVDDVENLHMTLGNEPHRIEDGLRWPVLVMNAALRQELLTRLEDFGLRPQGLVHPLDLWPVPETGRWHAYVGDDLAVVTGAHAGFVLPLADREQSPLAVLSAVLPQLQESESRPETIVLHGGTGDGPAIEPVDASRMAMHGVEVTIETHPASDWPTAWFASIARRRPLSAIEPAGAGRKRQQRRQWAWVAVLLALFGVALTVERGVNGWQAAAQSKKLQVQITRDFHEALPNVTRLVNARVQLEQAIAAVSGNGGDDGFLRSMSALAQGLSQAQTQDKSLSLTQVSFRDGRLVADLTGKEYDALQKMYGQLQQQAGLSVKRLTSGVEGGKARMRLEIATGNAGDQG